jgi:hypothetical protein
MNLSKPTKVVVPLAVGLAWGNDDYIYEEKLDGRFHTQDWRGNLLAGELMPTGEFFAWDILSTAGGDCRQDTAISRLNALIRRRGEMAADGIGLVPFSVGNGGGFLESVLSHGGEGIVRKHPQASWCSEMEACKRLVAFQCVVSKFVSGDQSVVIADAITGAARGKVALRAGKCDKVRVGSIIKVEGMGLTKRGFIREPSPDKDFENSWLVRF